MSKRPREEEESATLVTDTEATQDDTSRAPISKKLRIIQRVGPEVGNVMAQKSIDVFTDVKTGSEVLLVSCRGCVLSAGGGVGGG